MNIGSRLGGIGRAFAIPNFRIYWFSHISIILGTWINRLAVGWLTWELTHSTAWLGLIGAASMIPTIIFGPIAGVTADRYGHRLQLALATALGGLISLVLAILYAMDLIFIELLFALMLAAGTTRAFNIPARGALVSSVVNKDNLSAAIGVSSASFHGGSFFGPAIGGVIITAYGITPALLCFTIGSFFSVFMLMILRIEKQKFTEEKHHNILRELGDGFQYAFKNPALRSLLAMTFMISLFLQPYLEMLPGVAADVFNLGVKGLAMLTGATGLGAMVGGLWLAQRGRTEGMGYILLAASLLGACSLIVFGAVRIFPISLAMLFITGFALVAAHVCIESLLLNSVKGEVRARAMSINGVIAVGTPSLGAIGIGWAGTQYGVLPPILAAAILALLFWLFAAPQLWKHRTKLEE